MNKFIEAHIEYAFSNGIMLGLAATAAGPESATSAFNTALEKLKSSRHLVEEYEREQRKS